MRPLSLAVLLALCGCGACARTPSRPDAGPEPVVVSLPAGTHAGPLAVDGDTVFVGAGREATVVEAPADAPALTVPAGVTVVLRDLAFAGTELQHTVVVQGALVGERVDVRGGRAAFRVEDGSIELTGVVVSDAEAALRLVGGSADLDDVVATDVSAAAFFVARGLLTATVLRARNVEHGLLTRPDGRVDIEDLDVRGASLAGVGLVGGAGRIATLHVEGPVLHGGLVANDLTVPLVLEGATFNGMRAVGLSILRGEATVTGLDVAGVAADTLGDLGVAVYAETADLSITGGTLTDAAGAGFYVNGGTVALDGLRLERTGTVGLSAWNAATVALAGTTITQTLGHGLSAEEGAQVNMESGDLRGNQLGPAVADCATGARVVLASPVLVDGASAGCVDGP